MRTFRSTVASHGLLHRISVDEQDLREEDVDGEDLDVYVGYCGGRSEEGRKRVWEGLRSDFSYCLTSLPIVKLRNVFLILLMTGFEDLPVLGIGQTRGNTGRRSTGTFLVTRPSEVTSNRTHFLCWGLLHGDFDWRLSVREGPSWVVASAQWSMNLDSSSVGCWFQRSSRDSWFSLQQFRRGWMFPRTSLWTPPTHPYYHTTNTVVHGSPCATVPYFRDHEEGIRTSTWERCGSVSDGREMGHRSEGKKEWLS